MQAKGRVTLSCSKKLSSGQIDSFRVVVKLTDKDVAKKQYENQGYNVSVLG